MRGQYPVEAIQEKILSIKSREHSIYLEKGGERHWNHYLTKSVVCCPDLRPRDLGADDLHHPLLLGLRGAAGQAPGGEGAARIRQAAGETHLLPGQIQRKTTTINTFSAALILCHMFLF